MKMALTCYSGPNAIQLNPSFHLEQLHSKERLERECSDAYEGVKRKRREVERIEGEIKKCEVSADAYRKQLQTLQSNSSKFEQPVKLIERKLVSLNQQSAATSVASMGRANSQHSLNQERSTDSLTVRNAGSSEQVTNENTSVATSDASYTLQLPLLSTSGPSSYQRPCSSATPIRGNPTFPSLQCNLVTTMQSTDGTTVRSRPSRSARPSTGQARSAAPRCHRRRASLTEPPSFNSNNDCPNCAQLKIELQRSKQIILSLRLKQESKSDKYSPHT